MPIIEETFRYTYVCDPSLSCVPCVVFVCAVNGFCCLPTEWFYAFVWWKTLRFGSEQFSFYLLIDLGVIEYKSIVWVLHNIRIRGTAWHLSSIKRNRWHLRRNYLFLRDSDDESVLDGAWRCSFLNIWNFCLKRRLLLFWLWNAIGMLFFGVPRTLSNWLP